MITADPQRRAARLVELIDDLVRRAAAEDRDLIAALAPVVFAETPDRIALELSVEALGARLQDQFRFVAREMPPPIQLYRGLPGIHVAARNPEPAAWVSSHPANGLPNEVTVVETHTLDAPFIFESVKNYFRKAGLRVHSAIHPIFSVRRQWERIVWIGGPHEEGSKEVYCHFQIERIDSRDRLRHIEHELFSVLKSVFLSVESFADMTRVARESGARVRSRAGGPGEAEAARAFVSWLLQDNYVFQGLVRYRIGADGRPDRMDETALGVFTDPTLLPVVFPGFLEQAEPHIVPEEGDNRIVEVDYCNNAAAIYHLDPIDDVLIRQWGEDGRLAEATLLLGRFAKTVFTQKPADIPLLREKLDWILKASGATPNSHMFREMRALFNRFPVRDLLYTDAQSLKAIIERIVFMSGDDEIAVDSRRGPGYVALRIAFARSRYSYKVEADLRQALESAFGPISFAGSEDCAGVMLLVFYFDASRLERPVDTAEAHRVTAGLVTTWEDRVAVALVASYGDRDGRRLFDRYIRSETRSGLYRESTPPDEVPEDIGHLEALEAQLEVRILSRSTERATLTLYSVKSLGLTDTLRTLQNLGLAVAEDLRIPLRLPGGRRAFLYRFEIESPPDRIAALQGGAGRFAAALRALDEERATDDPLNALVLQTGLPWREVEVLRTLRNHLLQVRSHYNVETVNGVLLRNSAVSAALYRSFAARFDPGLPGERPAVIAAAEAGVRKALESVRSLAEDEVLRGFDNLIRASLRSNAYQSPQRPVFSIKVDSRRVEGMPSPRPMFEIYVHSRLLEGIHLRGGKVARGGIRWSDRHDDFRTEVLSLMKTQMVKNSVIVPVGSKGGFVLKGSVPQRPALDGYLIDRYREYVSGLLDVTDNIVDGEVLHPPEVVRHDADDSYLVVAADKGTAHLSDTANSVSAQYGFWLGDAFASGGSAGYDHKKMGITARGAWECVRHHFRNLGTDVQKEPFTAMGVGDMSGDVFGNGALLSRAMKLQGAFNHVHIFIDPDPDPERSFQERERLFDLPRSTWKDYDASLISKGGGVFERSAKAIPLSPEIRKLLELEGESASGEEVIRRMLTARVDLLYNGGIGTYVKGVSEDDADVGDRANDRVRVDGRELRARVVGEGGNLGFTQKGRFEFWAGGGLINTDAVDNSGGVDTSDHEVNIKILMNPLVMKGLIKGREERNRILMAMTAEVADLVLADNRDQSLALTLDGMRSAQRYEDFVAFIQDMVGAGVLNRADDAIPTSEELLVSPQRKRGLPRPLLAVLLGHTKNWAFQMVLETDFPDSQAAEPFLHAYFPKHLRESYAEHFAAHTLRREIVATVAVNHLINRAGMTFLERLTAAGKAGLGEALAAYLDVDRASGAEVLRERVLEAGLGAQREQETLLEVESVLEEQTQSVLEGKRASAAKALDPLRKRLKL